jgi:dihydrofolate reductase
MRKIVLSVHTSLDGFVAGLNGEMNWIRADEEMFELVGKFTDEADTALYGRVTYQMMDSYWPKAGDQPDASKHDIEHSKWYNSVEKVVLSTTLQANGLAGTTFIADNIPDEINRLKSKRGKNILIFGSPSAVHTLMSYNLIDEYWLFVNPVLLGKGIPLFANIQDKINLRYSSTKVFKCGVIGMHYTVER